MSDARDRDVLTLLLHDLDCGCPDFPDADDEALEDYAARADAILRAGFRRSHE